METTAAKKSSKKDYRKLILEEYVAYVLEHGAQPSSVFKFSKSIKMKEEEFYNHFSSFESVRSSIWTGIYQDTIQAVKSQEVYDQYSSRERFLSFLFTWIEELKKKRSYLLVLYADKIKSVKTLTGDTKEFKSLFKEFAGEILSIGKETEEIANRPFLSERYDDALWLQIAFVFRFWLDDNSPRFEKTDAAIEKSVNLAFDLMGQSALDTFLDFAKFLYQNN